MLIIKLIFVFIIMHIIKLIFVFIIMLIIKLIFVFIIMLFIMLFGFICWLVLKLEIFKFKFILI